MSELNRSIDATAERRESSPDRGLGPYLIVGLCWLCFTIFTLSIRVPTSLWMPVVDWAFPQAVLTEQLIPNLTRAQTYLVWLAAYVVIGIAAWFALERRRHLGSAHRWRRATIAWLVIQICYWAVLAVLVAKGIVFE